MKAIILVSSIFYLLGLKISHKFDLIKNVTPVEKVTVIKAESSQTIKAADYSNIKVQEPVTDTLSGGYTSGVQILENK